VAMVEMMKAPMKKKTMMEAITEATILMKDLRTITATLDMELTQTTETKMNRMETVITRPTVNKRNLTNQNTMKRRNRTTATRKAPTNQRTTTLPRTAATHPKDMDLAKNLADKRRHMEDRNLEAINLKAINLEAINLENKNLVDNPFTPQNQVLNPSMEMAEKVVRDKNPKEISTLEIKSFFFETLINYFQVLSFFFGNFCENN